MRTTRKRKMLAAIIADLNNDWEGGPFIGSGGADFTMRWFLNG